MGFFKSIFKGIGKIFKGILGKTGFQIFNTILTILAIATGNWWIISLATVSNLAYAYSVETPEGFADNFFSENFKKLTFGTKGVINKIIGLVKTSGNVVWADTKGKGNKILDMLILLSEGADEIIPAYTFNKKPYNLNIDYGKNWVANKGFEYLAVKLLYKDFTTSGIIKLYKDGYFSTQDTDVNVSFVNNKFEFSSSKEIIDVLIIKGIERVYREINFADVQDTHFLVKFNASSSLKYINHTGTIRILFADGTEEVIYWKKHNPRIRVSNPDIIQVSSTYDNSQQKRILTVNTTKEIVDIWFEKYGNISKGKPVELVVFENGNWNYITISGNKITTDISKFEVSDEVLNTINSNNFSVVLLRLYYKPTWLDNIQEFSIWIKNGNGNPAQAIRNLLIEQGLEDYLDNASFDDAINFCEEKDYKIGYVIRNEKLYEVIQLLLNSFRGQLIEKNGVIQLKYAYFDTNQTENIREVRDWDIKENSFYFKSVDIMNLPKKLTAEFIDYSKHFSLNRLEISTNTVNTSKTKTLRLPAMLKEKVEELASYYLDRTVLGDTISLVLLPEFIDVQVWDILKLNLKKYGIAGYYRVENVEIIDVSGMVKVDLKREDVSLYDKEINAEQPDYLNPSYEELNNCYEPTLDKMEYYLDWEGKTWNKLYITKEKENNSLFLVDKDNFNLLRATFDSQIFVKEDDFPVKTFNIIETKTADTSIFECDGIEYSFKDLEQGVKTYTRLLGRAYKYGTLSKGYTKSLFVGNLINFLFYTTDNKNRLNIISTQTTGKFIIANNYRQKILLSNFEWHNTFITHSHDGSIYYVRNVRNKFEYGKIIFTATLDYNNQPLYSVSFQKLGEIQNYQVNGYQTYVLALTKSSQANSNSNTWGAIVYFYDETLGYHRIKARELVLDGNTLVSDTSLGTIKNLTEEPDLNTCQFYFYTKTTGSKFRVAGFINNIMFIKKWGNGQLVQTYLETQPTKTYGGFKDNFMYFYNGAGAIKKIDIINLTNTLIVNKELEGEGSLLITNDNYLLALQYPNSFPVYLYNLENNQGIEIKRFI